MKMKHGRIQETIMNLKKMIMIYVLCILLIIGSAIGALVLMHLQYDLTIWIIVTGILDIMVTSLLIRVQKNIKNLKSAIENMNKVLDMYFEAMKNGNENK